MSVIAGTLGQVALFMQLHLSNPLGEAYWRECDDAGEAMQGTVEETFLAAYTNYRIGQVSWQSIHIEQNWAAWFSSNVMAVPLDGH